LRVKSKCLTEGERLREGFWGERDVEDEMGERVVVAFNGGIKATLLLER
jgi:hypothetical protein